VGNISLEFTFYVNLIIHNSVHIVFNFFNKFFGMGSRKVFKYPGVFTFPVIDDIISSCSVIIKKIICLRITFNRWEGDNSGLSFFKRVIVKLVELFVDEYQATACVYK